MTVYALFGKLHHQKQTEKTKVDQIYFKKKLVLVIAKSG